jgi:hypothetical protein
LNESLTLKVLGQGESQDPLRQKNCNARLHSRVDSSTGARSWYWSDHLLAGAGKTLFVVNVPLGTPKRRTTIGACSEGVEERWDLVRSIQLSAMRIRFVEATCEVLGWNGPSQALKALESH